MSTRGVRTEASSFERVRAPRAAATNGAPMKALWGTARAALAVLAVSCAGKYEASSGAAATGTPATGGALASGGAALGGASAASGGQLGSSGGSAGVADDSCFSVSPLPDAEPDFARPSVVRDRLSRFVLGEPSSDLSDDLQTTRTWASTLAVELLESSDAPPAFQALFAAWYDAWRASPPPAAADFGLRWAHALSLRGSLLPLLSPGSALESRENSLLTDPALLAKFSTISARGAWATSALLCVPFPSTPPGEGAPLPPQTALTNRELVARSVASPACMACHALTDPYGDSLENFDALGNYRTIDNNGLALDTSGSMITPTGTAVAFSSIGDLAPQLATSCEVAHCIAATLAAQAVSRAELTHPVSDEDVNRIANAIQRASLSSASIVGAIAATPAFLH